MRRWMLLGLSALCALMLWYGDGLFESLSGQMIFRMAAQVDEGLERELGELSKGLSLGVFALGDKQVSGVEAETFALYECLFYHPEAMGITLMEGSPITREQVITGERVILLSDRAAMEISPSLNCVGAAVEVSGETYKVVGIYKHYEPMGFLTRTAEASAIVPMRGDGAVRRLYIWGGQIVESPFAFQQTALALSPLSVGADAESFEAFDLGTSAQMNRQGIRFCRLLMLCLLCRFLWKRLADRRRAFGEAMRSAFARFYLVSAAVRLLWPFVRDMVPSLATVALVLYGINDFAGRPLISARRVPTQLLDPEAWLRQWVSLTINNNLSQGMPLYGYLLNTHVGRISCVFGVLCLCFLWMALGRQKGLEKG